MVAKIGTRSKVAITRKSLSSTFLTFARRFLCRNFQYLISTNFVQHKGISDLYDCIPSACRS